MLSALEKMFSVPGSSKNTPAPTGYRGTGTGKPLLPLFPPLSEPSPLDEMNSDAALTDSIRLDRSMKSKASKKEEDKEADADGAPKEFKGAKSKLLQVRPPYYVKVL
jgi:hypothetical protein